MEFPAGEKIEECLNVNKVNLEELLKSFKESEFSGYIAVTVYGYAGLEEGILMFKSGNLIGSLFTYDTSNQTIEGEEALVRTLNAFKADYGVIDINSLSKQQVELTITFKDLMKIKEYQLKDLVKMIPKTYSTQYSESGINESKEKSRYDIMKKMGLLGIDRV
jgi:hypothetical protein